MTLRYVFLGVQINVSCIEDLPAVDVILGQHVFLNLDRGRLLFKRIRFVIIPPYQLLANCFDECQKKEPLPYTVASFVG